MRIFASIKPIAKKVIPVKYHHTFGEIHRRGISLLLYGYRFTCPICGGHFRKFLPFGVKSRPNALCPPVWFFREASSSVIVFER